MPGVERVIRLGSMAYIDAKGRHLRADCGETVSVHPDNIDRFDRLNVLQGQAPTAEPVEPLEPVAKPRTRTRKED